ncbi:hypothetical protein SUDANB5_00028 [Streptomyces sp. SudanB5_2050]|uniref:transposase n=1 Tax=Streptomyces sp. SudanB5_2050 TaxID=3035274 RepID=UPI0036DD05C3
MPRTYLGLGTLERAHKAGLPGWDLIVVDEAHRASGRLGKPWAVVHDNTRVPALRRLYVTATPRPWQLGDDEAAGAPGELVRFAKEDCGQCPVKSSCTRGDRRQLNLNYALRAGIESTVNEFVSGHGMRQTRYSSQTKTHVQHVFTAIAVNIERVNAELTTPAAERQLQTPTALQNFLDWQGIPRPTSWRTAGKS